MTTKERIADVALSMLIEKGYQNTTIREIAQACGFSHVNILRHYNSKGKLAIHLIGEYIHLLNQTVQEQTKKVNIPPSYQYSDLFWLTHYTFLSNNRDFARFYYEVYESLRNEMYVLLTDLGELGHFITDMMGLPIAINDQEGELYSKLITDADIHMVQMLIDDKISPVWAASSIAKLLQMLFLRRYEEQIVYTVEESWNTLENELNSCVSTLYSNLLHKN